MSNLELEYVPVKDLRTFHRNPRQGDVTAIQRSLRVNGQYKPIVVNRGTHTSRVNEVLAGNHTLTAARDEAWTDIAVVWVDVDDDQAARIVAADNRIGDLGSYDERLLAELLGDLPDLDGTGYTEDDLDALVRGLQPAGELAKGDDEDEAPVPEPPKDPITRPGDVWQLGPHRLICGDSRDAGTVARLLDGAAVNVAFTSPPYASQRGYDPSSGFKPIPPAGYAEWFEAVQANVREHLATDGSWFVNIKAHCDDGQRHLYVHDLVLAHVRAWGWRFVDELCWFDTSNGFPGAFPNRFKDAWEPVFHFSANPRIKFHALANGRPSDDVVKYDRASHMHMAEDGYRVDAQRTYESGIARPSNVVQVPAGGDGSHSAAFPVKLPAWFIRAYSDPGDVIFDPFAGSSSTIIAAENEGRIGYGVELSPGYCDVACWRFQQRAGEQPSRDGKPHDFTDEAGQ